MDCLDITQTGRRSALRTRPAISPALLALPVAFLMLTLYSASAWAQVTIMPGDIVVVDANAVDGNGAIFRVTPGGTRTILSSGQFFHEPVGIAIETGGTIVVTDRGFSASDKPAVVRVDPRLPTASNQTIVHQGAPFIDPFGITIGAGGLIYITDTGCVLHATNCPTGTANANVYSVNPTSGAVTLVSSGQFLRNPFGIEAEDAGTLVVTDAISGVPPLTGAGGIIRINPNPAFATTNQTVVHVSTAGSNPTSSDGCPFGTTVEPVTGNIFNSVFDSGAFSPFGCAPGGLWRALPVFPGANTAVSPHSQIPWMAPFGMKVDTNPGVTGTLLVVDEFYRDLYRVCVMATGCGNTTNGGIITNFFINDTIFVAPTDVDVYTALNIPPNLSQGADLSVTKDDGVTTVTAGDGQTYTYTITVHNSGPNTALDVTLTDTWPSGFNRTSLSCTPTTGMSTGNGSFTCSLGNIVSGDTVTVTAKYTVPSTTPTGSQTNQVDVSSSSTTDLNPSNNTASDTNTVNAAPSAPPAKWTGGGQIDVTGGKATFGFTVERKVTNGPVKGQLEFLNHVSRYNFKSISISTLTVSGNRAQFTGTGQRRVGNGSWSGPFNFTVTVYDGPDRFKIDIMDGTPGTTAGSEVTPIRNGQIKQHN